MLFVLRHNVFNSGYFLWHSCVQECELLALKFAEHFKKIKSATGLKNFQN